jgi:hypothetical protein
MPMRLTMWMRLASLALVAGCSRSEQTIELKAAFSDDTVVGRLGASWRPAAEPRALDVRIEAVNELADRLYVRIQNVRLIGPDGPIAIPDADSQCTLPAKGKHALIETRARIPVDAASIRDIQVDQLAVPLSERGRAFYREFLLRKRGGPVREIDAELDAFAAAPPCR